MTVTKDILKAPTLQETAHGIANSNPEGRAWNVKNQIDSKFYDLIESVGAQLNEVQQEIEETYNEIRINTTLELMPEHLKDSGLPDTCIQELGNLEEKRQKILSRLNKIQIVTLEEMEQLIFDLIGLIITITPGSEYVTLPLPQPPFIEDGSGTVIIDACSTNDVTSITSALITPVSITSIERLSVDYPTIATVTIGDTTGLYVGMKILISGSSIPAYDGEREITSILSGTEFTFDILGDPTTPSAGGQYVYTEATVITPDAHTLNIQDRVAIQGAVETDYNGIFIVNSVTPPTQFTYTFTSTPTSPATGTITYRLLCCVNVLPYPLPLKFLTDKCKLIGCILREVLPAKTSIIFLK